MNREVLLRSPAGNRRQPLLAEKGSGAKERRLVGEVAGGTAAECAAICCCCPCSVMNLLILAVYKVPAGLCRKAWEKKKRQRLKKKKKKTTGLLPESGCTREEEEELEAEVKRVSRIASNNNRDDDDAVDLEKEMRDRFFGGGFWRSPSQREAS